MVSYSRKRVSGAVEAAVSVVAAVGYPADAPCVVADSNHTIVWLRPHEIVAKVGRPSADGLLVREHGIGAALAQAGAPIAPPIPDVEPTCEPETDLLVTLWRRLQHGDEEDADPADVGESLRAVHNALDLYTGELPSFLDKLESARALLADDTQMTALDPHDRRFLCATFDALTAELSTRHYRTQRLHGEPHGRNRLTTPGGVKWIDFEGVCVGPLEWDIAFIPQGALTSFPPSDTTLLELLRTLNSARTAILCWARYEVPALQWHAKFHLQQVRDRTRRSTPQFGGH